MAFIPAVGVVKVCLHFTIAGQNLMLCLHFKKSSGAVSDADLDALAASASDAWNTILKPNFTTQISHVFSTATDLTTQAGHQSVHTPVSPVPGTGGATALPTNVAAVVTTRTAGRGRSRRGRMYWPGLDSGSPLSPIALTTTFITNLLADVGGFIAQLEAVTSPTYDAVVVSKQENNVEQNPANTFSITAITMDSFFDSQRRRLGGRGT